MLDLVFFLLALGALWLGAGLSVGAVEKVARHLRISFFFTSFIVLGTLTSVSEISVAIFSVVDKTPSISVGNLLGASIVLTLFAVPLLAIFNKGVKLDDRTEHVNFNVAYLVISLPALLVLDKSLSFFDAGIILCSFVFLGITMSNKSSLMTKLEQAIIHPQVDLLKELTKILIGVVMIVFASKFIVDVAVSYSKSLSVSPFLVGALVLSIGTNLPEISVLIRSTLAKKKNIALGDYVGSSVMNSLTLVGLTLFNGAPIALNSGLKLNILLLPLGSILFVYMTRDGRLEKREGLVLLGLYFLFVLLELFPVL